MAGEGRPAGPPTAPFLSRPIHHVGFHVPDLRAAIDAWVTAYGAGPFYLLEHVTFDECTSRGAAVAWDHSAGFGQCGAIPVELQQVHDLRPGGPAGPLTADGRTAVNHVGVSADDPAAESARLQSLGLELRLYTRLGDLEFFGHDATEMFGYAIGIITAGPGLDAFWDTAAAGARDWDGRDPVRSV